MTNEIVTAESVLDLMTAMSNMDGDAELLQEIVEIFLETAEAQFAILRQSIHDRNADQVAIQAHAMKGGASNFCAGKFVSSAQKLELLAKGGSLDGAEALLQEMQDDLAEVAEVAPAVNWSEIARNWRG